MVTPDNYSPDLHDPRSLWEWLAGQVDCGERDKLAAAYHLAERVHEGQTRKTTAALPLVPYIVHPLRVARILIEEWGRNGLRALSICLLHDVLEDCNPEVRRETEQELLRVAGKEVYEAVCILTKPGLGSTENKSARDARYFSILFRASETIRLIKCADRVDNLRDACAWGNAEFWSRYSSETIGWHLYLARDTAAIAEVAIFKALVEGERQIRGSAPVWADGHLVDRTAAVMIPEHIARNHELVGLALQGNTLIVGMRDPGDDHAVMAVRLSTQKEVLPVHLSIEALRDALTAGLFGRIE